MADCIEGHPLKWRGRKKSMVSSHLRALYIDTVGPLADDQQVHHICENPWCAEPSHLEALTHRQHVARHRWRGLEYGFDETAFL